MAMLPHFKFDAHGMTSEEIELIDRVIDEHINSDDIVIFSKTTCVFCMQAKRLLENEGFTYQAIELDTMKDYGVKIQMRLDVRYRQKTVPNIFIKTHHVGGYSDLNDAKKTGLLYEYMDGIFLSQFEYDLVVIGGGSGGIAAAKEAAKYKKRVALFDYVSPSPRGTVWGLGGTCVNVGCIPKKLFHKAALMKEEFSTDALQFGLVHDKVTHDWDKLIDSVQKHIRKLNWNYRKELSTNGIKYYPHYASFDSDHVIKFKPNGEDTCNKITTKNIVLAMGCRPSYINFIGAREYCITSDDLFSLKYPPGKTLIVGASYIALECAGFLRSLGYECTVVVRSVILRTFDRGMAENIGVYLENIGVKFLYHHKIMEVTMEEEGFPPTLKVTGICNDGSQFSLNVNTVILATGREPQINGLGLNIVGVNIHPETKKILVSNLDQTSNRTIFAIGDIVHGVPELTPVAIKAGVLLIKRLYSKSNEIMDYDLVATTVFTPIEYSSVGLSEEKAKERYGDLVVIYQNSFRPLETVLSVDRFNKCCIKLICIPEKGKHKIVGLHILSPNSGEIIQGFVVAIKLGATKEDLDELIGIHPTCAEVITNLKLRTGEDNDEEESC